ncbi:MAG: hypothetical protein WBA13_12195 [Microcoleaceae cyanobacterium]
MSLDRPSTEVDQTSLDNATPNKESKQYRTYAEKTDRLLAWGQVLRSIAPLIWAIVIAVVILPLIGQFFMHRAFNLEETKTASIPQVTQVQPSVNWTEVDEAIATAVTNAHEQAENYASDELDTWINELMGRVDPNFLDWYFSYFNQKKIEINSVLIELNSGVYHLLKKDAPTPSEKLAQTLTQNFQTEFSKRVLRPQIAQLRLERITQKTVQIYLDQLTINLDKIPLSYQIPQADWNRYLNDIAISIQDTEGQISTLSLKVLVGGGAYLAVKPIVAPLLLKVGSKVMANVAGKAGAKVAVKAGAKLTGKMAAGLLDCVVGAGILIWDVWDTYHTAAIEKPILKEMIGEYLEQVKGSILENPETGIMTAINQIESQLFESENIKSGREVSLKLDTVN